MRGHKSKIDGFVCACFSVCHYKIFGTGVEQMPKVCVRLLRESIDDPENEGKKLIWINGILWKAVYAQNAAENRINSLN